MTLVLHTDTATVLRLAQTGDKEAYNATPVAENVPCQIIPAGTDVLAIYGGNPSYALYEICFDQDLPIKQGDKFVTAEREYIVQDTPTVTKNPYFSFTKVVAGVVL